MDEKIERDRHNVPTLSYIKWVAQSIDVRDGRERQKFRSTKKKRAGS
jgi:hypothetical protein